MYGSFVHYWILTCELPVESLKIVHEASDNTLGTIHKLLHKCLCMFPVLYYCIVNSIHIGWSRHLVCRPFLHIGLLLQTYSSCDFLLHIPQKMFFYHYVEGALNYIFM